MGPGERRGPASRRWRVRVDPAASPARPPAGDEPMPEASRTLARRELERLTTERDEALAALAAERAARERSERADAYARLLAENRRLASENAEPRRGRRVHDGRRAESDRGRHPRRSGGRRRTRTR